MQRRRKRPWRHLRPAPLAVGEIQAVVVADLRFRSGAPVEIREIGATPQRNVLAIVHFTAVRKRVGRSASTQVGTLLDQPDFDSGFSQRDGGGQTRQTAADHQNALRGHPASTTVAYDF